jgi:phosphoserine phosphatase RsbU/P
MSNTLNILLVEDSKADADLLIRFLKKEAIDFEYVRVWERHSFGEALKNQNFDLIIADHNMPQFSGMEAFRLTKTLNIHTPFILITGSVSEKLLTEYTKEGIDDYILKGNLLRLPAAIQNVLNKKGLERLYDRLEIAHKDIRDSINYAKMIQDAMLPRVSVLNDCFPNSGIFFKPKDILSGDFYWFEKRGDDFFLAVADCTGHGVPGAILSVMGHNLLNEAVINRKIDEPASVLEHVSLGVKRMMKQGVNSMYDGMDMVFCRINAARKKLIFSGANRPLLILRGNDLLEFRPTKLSIGGFNPETKNFVEQEIDLLPRDRIFLFSDGYADQFHFKTGKKLMVKNLKKLFQSTASLPFADQVKYISSFFDIWKGNSEQVDDVLLLMVEIPR